MQAYRVQLASDLLSEASVSAILGFTWLNPRSGRREEGVFKVMKPHIPACYAEDLALLQQLAEHLASSRADYEFGVREAADTLDEVRILLASEVDFRREQATLAEIGRVYHCPGAHAPRPIPELCADNITAMSVEHGVKVTEAFRMHPRWRRRAATKVVEALIADPVFSPYEDAVFHADPHAGNLLYDQANHELIILDWALTGRLSLEERRQLARLIIMMTFRDARGVRAAIHQLSRGAGGDLSASAALIDKCVDSFFQKLPHVCSLGALDAMRLLDRIGLEGVRFPASLVLIRKVLFTLDGVLRDVAGEDVRLDSVIAREFVARWFKQFGLLPAPFKLGDLLAVERSALFYASGLWSWTS
jgi:ubiquinone biosynthesis protein